MKKTLALAPCPCPSWFVKVGAGVDPCSKCGWR